MVERTAVSTQSIHAFATVIEEIDASQRAITETVAAQRAASSDVSRVNMDTRANSAAIATRIEELRVVAAATEEATVGIGKAACELQELAERMGELTGYFDC